MLDRPDHVVIDYVVASGRFAARSSSTVHVPADFRQSSVWHPHALLFIRYKARYAPRGRAPRAGGAVSAVFGRRMAILVETARKLGDR
jgi:hypothetical protein